MVQQVLQQLELQHSTVQRTPLPVDHRLSGPFPDEPFEPSGTYAELVGCLMYLMTCTRPDLSFHLSILARFAAPGRHRPVHWTAAMRVAKYLATTSGVRLVLGGTLPVVLTGHCDSSYADDAETHKSTQGYCFNLGSGAVPWRSTCSSSVLTSVAEAEIYAGAMAAQELRWLTFLLTYLGERPSSAPTLFTDNKATILLFRELRLESRVKHINIRSRSRTYFLLRNMGLPMLQREMRSFFSLPVMLVTLRSSRSARRVPRSSRPSRSSPFPSSVQAPTPAPVSAASASADRQRQHFRAALPCLACRTALLAARCPSLPVAPPSLPRAALPYTSRRPAGCAPPSPALPCPRATLPCPRAALPCPRAALLAARRSALPAHRPAHRQAALPCPRAALPADTSP
ncbi:unnamed protein product [Closterium sp. NIES-54]